MKKLIAVVLIAGVSVAANARMCPCPPPHPGSWTPPQYCHGCSGNNDFWGKGGRNFWPGFIGGFVGAVVSAANNR